MIVFEKIGCIQDLLVDVRVVSHNFMPSITLTEKSQIKQVNKIN